MIKKELINKPVNLKIMVDSYLANNLIEQKDMKAFLNLKKCLLKLSNMWGSDTNVFYKLTEKSLSQYGTIIFAEDKRGICTATIIIPINKFEAVNRQITYNKIVQVINKILNNNLRRFTISYRYYNDNTVLSCPVTWLTSSSFIPYNTIKLYVRTFDSKNTKILYIFAINDNKIVSTSVGYNFITSKDNPEPQQLSLRDVFLLLSHEDSDALACGDKS